MKSKDELSSNDASSCFVKENEVYVVYLPSELETEYLNIGTSKKEFNIKWYNPRSGGEFAKGSISSLFVNNEPQHLGMPPSRLNKDWIVIPTREKP